jgi:hypothetical protein
MPESILQIQVERIPERHFFKGRSGNPRRPAPRSRRLPPSCARRAARAPVHPDIGSRLLSLRKATANRVKRSSAPTIDHNDERSRSRPDSF